jgi:hypothetical protein
VRGLEARWRATGNEELVMRVSGLIATIATIEGDEESSIAGINDRDSGVKALAGTGDCPYQNQGTTLVPAAGSLPRLQANEGIANYIGSGRPALTPRALSEMTDGRSRDNLGCRPL